MAGFVWWFVVAFVLLIAELLTGTFYLLVIAIALAAAGLASLAGAGLVVQLLVATITGVGGAILLRQTRAGRLGRPDPADPVQNLDVGQSLRVEHWSGGRTARASYRGAQWDVELATGEEPAPGEFVIREIHGSRLIVGTRRVG